MDQTPNTDATDETTAPVVPAEGGDDAAPTDAPAADGGADAPVVDAPAEGGDAEEKPEEGEETEAAA